MNHIHYRTYKHKHKEPNELVAWIDRRCKVCGRFLKKNNTTNQYCLECSRKHKNEEARKRYRNNILGHKDYQKLRNKIDRLNVGDIV